MIRQQGDDDKKKGTQVKIKVSIGERCCIPADNANAKKVKFNTMLDSADVPLKFQQVDKMVNGTEKIAITDPVFDSTVSFNKAELNHVVYRFQIVENAPMLFVFQNGRDEIVDQISELETLQEIMDLINENAAPDECCIDCGDVQVCGSPACCEMNGFEFCCEQPNP